MSGFDLGWLDLREPADRAARDAGLLRRAAERLAAAEAPLAVDLGCGSGSTVRAFAPVLLHSVAWRLVDNDALLLAEAARRIGSGQAVEPVVADLVDLDSLSFDDAALVTASALLDLASEAWVETLSDRLAIAGCGLYAALNYDGEMRWAEPHPLDAPMTAAFNTHQRSDKGFGPALGPAASTLAAARFEGLGYQVFTASSPWRLQTGEIPLERELVEGVAMAVAETGIIPTAELQAWRRERLARLGSGCLVGHQDLLALPPVSLNWATRIGSPNGPDSTEGHGRGSKAQSNSTSVPRS